MPIPTPKLDSRDPTTIRQYAAELDELVRKLGPASWMFQLLCEQRNLALDAANALELQPKPEEWR